jgi:hypothetical protein
MLFSSFRFSHWVLRNGVFSEAYEQRVLRISLGPKVQGGLGQSVYVQLLRFVVPAKLK